MTYFTNRAGPCVPVALSYEGWPMKCQSSDRGITITLTEPEAESLVAYLDRLPACEVVRTMGDSEATGSALMTLRVLHGELRRPSPIAAGRTPVRAPHIAVVAKA